jgi:ubiquinone/menaquinone biosynthesis C-methylase UbiE/predicted transcriptional regulator
MVTVKYFKALADETRLRLFRLLMNYEFNVNEIVSIMGMGQSRISRHLKILTETGLLHSRRDGSYVYYHSVDTNELSDLIRFVDKSFAKYDEFSKDHIRSQNLISERKSRMQRFFDGIAEKWDTLKQDIFGDFDLNARIIEKVDNCGVAVDLGCGTGELLIVLAAKSDRVIGVDSSPNMLEQARLKAATIKERVDLRLGEMEHLPIRDGEADMAVASMVLHHLVMPAAGIREIHRILKPGGRLLITDFEKHDIEMVREKCGDPWLGFKKGEIEKWLSDSGFAITDTDRFKIRHGLEINLFLAEKL